jgi:glycosyltransferase involved in cell wall biosynthesis
LALSPNSKPQKLRLAILQRVCTGYRKPLFSNLSSVDEIEFKLFIGEDLPDSKVKSKADLDGVNHKKIKTSFLNFGGRVLPWQRGLVDALREYEPDVILCEGESHLLGYMQAFFYQTFYNKKTALIHWCFTSLPHEKREGRRLALSVKAFFRKFFDAFVAYSSFSKDKLVELGVAEEKIFVATNVGDTQHFLDLANSLSQTPAEARLSLKMPNKFTVIYVGTLDQNKRPDMLLELAKVCDPEQYNFAILGNGPLYDELCARVAAEELTNVFLPGRVMQELPLYFRAADALLVPGRGGIVISEAMAYGVPTIIFAGDGTEYDLIHSGVSGFITDGDDVDDFKKALEILKTDPKKHKLMGLSAKKLLEEKYTLNNMVKKIISAANFVAK